MQEKQTKQVALAMKTIGLRKNKRMHINNSPWEEPSESITFLFFWMWFISVPLPLPLSLSLGLSFSHSLSLKSPLCFRPIPLCSPFLSLSRSATFLQSASFSSYPCLSFSLFLALFMSSPIVSLLLLVSLSLLLSFLCLWSLCFFSVFPISFSFLFFSLSFLFYFLSLSSLVSPCDFPPEQLSNKVKSVHKWVQDTCKKQTTFSEKLIQMPN